jgi:VWFA-related protein
MPVGRSERHHRAVWLICSAFVAVLLQGLASSQQEQVFKAGNQTVAVYVTVTDAGGRLVPDLELPSFMVFDDHKRQDLTLFANDIQPITVVMLLDRSGSMRANFRIEEDAAASFVDAMLPADKARIGSFSNRIQLDPVDFTSDHHELHTILRTELQDQGPTPLWNAVNVGITALLHQQGRRVILVFTDGVDRPLNFQGNNNSLKDVMKRAEEENVMVYAVGLAGNNSPASGWRPVGSGHGGGWGGHGGFGHPGWGGGFPGGYGGSRGGSRPAPSSEKPDEGLPKIAAATGGGYFELMSADDLGSTFRRVADELHHQYALGFAPAKLDGKMHAIEVRLSDANMTARARKNYLAESDRP